MPPVTAERSPPASRITGADSPVIADSLTEATPSMISPSPGIMSPASTSTTSPTLQVERVDALDRRPSRSSGSTQRLALRVAARRAQRVGLRLAAPFGDGFGEIGEQHGEPQPERDLAGEQRRAVAVTQIAHEEARSPRSDDDLGDEDHRDCAPACADRACAARRPPRAPRIVGSNRPRGLTAWTWRTPIAGSRSEGLAGEHQEMLDDRPEREGGEVLQAARG